MGFYELSNGCDSCETISSVIPSNVNMGMDPNSALIASMGYGTQANSVQQYNNNISSSGYVQQGSNFGVMGGGSNGGSMGGGQRQPAQQQGQQQASHQQQASQPKVVKQVVTTTTTTPLPPVAPVANTYAKMEGFTDGSGSGSNMMGMGNDKNWIVLGLVIFSAMALNECCKYFLNKSLQLNDGSPMYYVAYVVVAILLALAANKYACSA
jgi:hypothetical protein